MASLKGNILLNGINTITSIIFPVITFPYAARILLPDGIGIVNFLNSIIGYIVLLTSLGIPMYAVKEIAKYQDDPIKRNKATIEITLLSIILCLIGYIITFILATFVPQIHQYASLFYILSLSILFTAIGVNWFYQGIEEFKFITIRAIIIRCISACALFIFVKNKTDLLVYGLVIVGSTVGNNLVNFIHLRKYLNIKLVRIRDLNVFKHLRPSLQVFILNLIISLYIQLNTVMLGFMSNDDEVGYFTAGTKITHIGLTLITSMGIVLFPRCSHLLNSGDIDGFSKVIKKSINITFGLSLPIAIGLILLAKPVTLIFCGNEFEDAIPILCLNAPVIIFISLTNVLGIQVLYPLDKIKIVILSVSFGAIINLILNFLLIPHYGAVGAAISTFFAELTVLIVQITAGKYYFPMKIRESFSMSYLWATGIMAIVVYFVTIPLSSNITKLIVGCISGLIIYTLTLILFKNYFVLDVVNTFLRYINKTQK